MSAKYIIFNCDGHELPVVFPELIAHKEMAIKTEMGINCAPISAAFWRWENGKIVVEGFSKGLGLEARPQDAELIEKFFLTSKKL